MHPAEVYLGFQSTNFYCLNLWQGWTKLMQAKTRTRTTRLVAYNNQRDVVVIDLGYTRSLMQ